MFLYWKEQLKSSRRGAIRGVCLNRRLNRRPNWRLPRLVLPGKWHSVNSTILTNNVLINKARVFTYYITITKTMNSPSYCVDKTWLSTSCITGNCKVDLNVFPFLKPLYTEFLNSRNSIFFNVIFTVFTVFGIYLARNWKLIHHQLKIPILRMTSIYDYEMWDIPIPPWSHRSHRSHRSHNHASLNIGCSV